MGLLVIFGCEQGGFEPEMIFHPGVESLSALDKLTDVVIAFGRIAEIDGFGPAVFEIEVYDGYKFRHVGLRR
jgi:hypothetical protein